MTYAELEVYEKFLDNILNGKVFAEEADDVWHVYDDKILGVEYSCYANSKEQAIERTKFAMEELVKGQKENIILNENFKCPFCFKEGKQSRLYQWEDTWSYHCDNEHAFQIVRL